MSVKGVSGMKEIKEADDIDADKYVSNEIPMTKREKERFILEAKALRQNLQSDNFVSPKVYQQAIRSREKDLSVRKIAFLRPNSTDEC